MYIVVIVKKGFDYTIQSNPSQLQAANPMRVQCRGPGDSCDGRHRGSTVIPCPRYPYY
jgi:hypothetical protein